MTTKKIWIRNNVKGLVDMDYLDKLSPEEKEFMNKFTDEYYAGGFTKEDSLHRQAFGEEYETKIKKEMYFKHNGENRCVTGIASGSDYLTNIDDFTEYLFSTISDEANVKEQLNTSEPSEVFMNLLNETADEIDNMDGSTTIEKLKDYTLKVNALFCQMRKDKDKQKKAAKKNKVKDLPL